MQAADHQAGQRVEGGDDQLVSGKGQRDGVERRQPSFKERRLQKIVNELKRGAKGYRKCTSLDDWLANVDWDVVAGRMSV